MEHKFDAIIKHVIEIKTEQARQGEKIDQNTEDLREHIEGVKQNRIRIECLEKDRERSKAVKKFIVTLSGVLAGIAGVISVAFKYIIE